MLTSSCHPIECTKNIPYSLGLRILRICTNPEVRDMRLQELKKLLLAGSYPEKLVNTALDKVKLVSRSIALKRDIGKKQRAKQRPVFAVRFDPRQQQTFNVRAEVRSVSNFF